MDSSLLSRLDRSQSFFKKSHSEAGLATLDRWPSRRSLLLFCYLVILTGDQNSKALILVEVDGSLLSRQMADFVILLFQLVIEIQKHLSGGGVDGSLLSRQMAGPQVTSCQGSFYGELP